MSIHKGQKEWFPNNFKCACFNSRLS